MEDFIRTHKSNGIVPQQYKGNYSLAAAYETKGGKVNMKWGKEQVGMDQFADKATPVKISLGDKETATAALLMALKYITGKDYIVSDKKPQSDTGIKHQETDLVMHPEDDVPF